jgi:hypothetical protein
MATAQVEHAFSNFILLLSEIRRDPQCEPGGFGVGAAIPA